VYGTLAQIKQRILNQGQPLSIDDVFALVSAHQARSGGSDPLVLGPPRFVLSFLGTGERMSFHREFLHNLRIPQRPLLTLNEETLIETLVAILNPRHYSAAERQELLVLSFPQFDQLNILRILDTIYKATFSRTIRKDLCDPKILFSIPEGQFHLSDQHRSALFTMTCNELFRHLLLRLYRTPDLVTILDTDDRTKGRIQENLRFLSGSLHDAATLPQKQQEVAALLRDRRGSEGAGEDLEELEPV